MGILNFFNRDKTEEKKKDKINENLINNLSTSMKQILMEELKSGNEIVETAKGGFSNFSDEHIFIFLNYPFKSKIQLDLNGIVYREINDKHYWKAEYTDENNHETIACNFLDVYKLKKLLKKSGVSKNLYNLDDQGRDDERLCLNYREGKWNVYYIERGVKTTNLFFENESEACEYIYNKLVL